MKRSTTVFIVLPLILWFSAPVTLLAAQPYHWPLSSPTHVTSTIGEYRGDHLHNGIDFSTLGEDGRKVFAIDTGTVQRVFYDADKYGRTVVLKHPNGRKSWYSHLRRLSPALRLRLEQSLEPGTRLQPSKTISIDRGQVIGRAGQSGRGGPHLHLALVGEEGGFLNPLGRFEPNLPITARPTVQSVRLMPLGGEGWIDGDPTQMTYEDLPRRRIELWGRIGVSVTLWNRHPRNGHRSLPETILLKKDGEVLVKRSFNRLSPDVQQKGVYRVFNTNRSNLSPTSFTVNLTPVGPDGHWKGLSFFKEERSGRLEIVIETASGKKTTSELSYGVVPPPATFQWFPEQITNQGTADVLHYSQLTRIQPASPRFLVASLSGRQTALKQYSPPRYKDYGPAPDASIDHAWAMNRLRLSVQIDGSWKGWPSLKVTQDSFVATPPLIQVEPGKFVTWWEPDISRDGWHRATVRVSGQNHGDTASERIYLQALRKGKEGAVVSLDGRYSLFHPGDKLSFSSFVSFKNPSGSRTPRDELHPVGTPVRIEPDYLQSPRRFVLTAGIPDTVPAPSHVGLYRYNPVSQRWNLLSQQRGFDKRTREANVHQAGTVGLFRDQKPPRIRSVKRVNQNKVRLRIQENGSGIRREDISARIAGHPTDVRWLEIEQWIELNIPANTSLSKRTLSVEIADRAGRRTTWEGVIEDL